MAAAGALLLAGTALARPAPAQEGALREARQAQRAGRWDEALDLYRALSRRADAPAAAHRGVADVLMTLGRYDEAARHLEALPDPDPAVTVALGRAREATGDLDAAEAAWREAEGGRGEGAVEGRIELAELLWKRGRRDEARRLLDSFFDLYNDGRATTATELAAVGRAVWRLGATDPALFHDALKALDEAAAADPADPVPHLLTGELFLEKYVSPEAHASFQRVLAANPDDPRALLGEARALEFDGTGGAMARARQALEVNPEHAAARAFLARLHADVEEWERARDEAERALESNPASLEALSVLAGVHYLTGDEEAWERVRDRAAALWPSSAELLVTVADMAVRQRRYPEAVALARPATVRDPLSAEARGILGMNLLRVRGMAEGRSFLEEAFEADPFNPWYKNTLDLLDALDSSFRTVRTPRFELVLREDEAELLAPYVESFAQEAWDSLSARYGVEPETPLRIEVFPSHADFSVRTLGIPGLGALGVSFGPVLVMDSPAAREPGAFNWASTLWHELAHSFHLALTEGRVPRWFSEGLAVHEQRAARPGWGHAPTVGFVRAWREGRLHPVSELNRGFMRPDYPQQVPYSYLQASLVFAMIEEAHGRDAPRRMLDAYGRGLETPEVVRSVLGLDMDELDERFEAWMDRRFESALAGTVELDDPLPPGAPLDALRNRARRHPGDFGARLAAGRALVEAGELDEAEGHLKAALGIFPSYGAPDGPWWWLARLHRERGERERAAAALAQLGGLAESAVEVHRAEAGLRLELGDTVAAARALERALVLHPYDADAHRELAGLLEVVADHEAAVRERRAVLALDPADRADAHYRLAAALLRAGRRDEARTQVLRALEVAPNFAEALELLLEIRGGSS